MSSSAGGARAWRLRAWDDPLIERAMIADDLIAMSADEIGDVTDEPTPEEYRARLRESPQLADRSAKAIGSFVGYWRRFRSEMQVGDVVAVPLSGRRVAIGEVVGEYAYRSREPEQRLRHVRPVRWLSKDMLRAELDDDLRRVVNAPGTICAIGAYSAPERLRRLAER